MKKFNSLTRINTNSHHAIDPHKDDINYYDNMIISENYFIEQPKINKRYGRINKKQKFFKKRDYEV